MPQSARELNTRGVALARQQQYREAAECFAQAVEADPLFSQAHANLAHALELTGDLQAAIVSFERARQLDPARIDLQNKLGTVYAAAGDFRQAADCFRTAISLSPHYAPAYNNLGIALSKLQHFEDSVAALRRAVELDPNDANGYANLGGSLVWIDGYEEAEACLKKALQLAPQHADAHSNMGLLLKEQGRIDEALVYYEAAIKLKPDSAEAHKNRAMSLFLKGDFAAGWPEYEWRVKLGDVRVTYSGPRWDGSPLAGRTLLLEAEQGLGDTIQFVRYAAEIKRCHKGRVVFACDPPLLPLLRGAAGIDQLISQSQPRPPFDLWSPLMSVPGIISRGRDSIVANVPYLAAEPARIDRWKSRLASLSRRRIGVAWQGNPARRNDRKRSFPLTSFAPLARLPQVTLVSLQKGDTGPEEQQPDVPVVSLGNDCDPPGEAFLDTAAVMMNLDLVITADTSIAHVAGALGVPVWVALAAVPDWRWTMHGETTPWYPTMRLFRQRTAGDWGDVFERMRQTASAEFFAREQPF